MARLPRLSIAGVPQHIIQRGNNRKACFFDDQDYAVYLDKLKEYSRKYNVQVHAYVLMTNHVHLLVTPTTDTGVSQMMQSLGRYYVRYVNTQYRRTGSLWEGRYKSTLVDTERYFLVLCRYIELNPVRAEMVDHPSEYPWSSYHAHALGKRIELLTPHTIYIQLGVTASDRAKYYRRLFDGHIPDKTLNEIRQATNKSWVLGSEYFQDQIAKQTGRPARPRGRGGDRKSQVYREKQNQLH